MKNNDFRDGMSEWSVAEFCRALASDAAAPGGGSGSALATALAAALGAMAGEISVRHASGDAAERLTRLGERAGELRHELLRAMDEDAAAYSAFTETIRRPRDDPDRAAARESALVRSAAVPLEILKRGGETLTLLEEYAILSTPALRSDVAAAAAILSGALHAAAVNVRVNTAAMKDRRAAEDLNEKTEALLEEYVPRADAVFEKLYGSM